MNSGNRNKTQGSERRPGSRVMFAALLSLLLLLGFSGHAFGQRERAARPAARARVQARPMRPQRGGARAGTNGANRGFQPRNNGGYRPVQPMGQGAAMRPGVSRPVRPGQERLPEWMAQHQNMSPTQQENLLRREPGFNRLSPDQQQRVMNRLRTLDARPPVERQRTLARNEAFERLSPGAKQDVRSSAQSLAQMPADRQRMVRQAFNNLRHIPLDQRQQILNSARFSQEFSPQERHVLGSLLSIEPYEPGTY